MLDQGLKIVSPDGCGQKPNGQHNEAGALQPAAGFEVAYYHQRGSGEEYNCEQHSDRHESDGKQRRATSGDHWFLIFT
jgi:hypothetical protein